WNNITMDKTTQRCLLLFLCLSVFVQRSAALVFWTAVVEVVYINNNNETVNKYCECGIYGRNSPLEGVMGVVTLPRGDPRGCGPDPVYNRNGSSPPWIALIKRGNCTFSEKINAAKHQGASGVVVYNYDSTVCKFKHFHGISLFFFLTLKQRGTIWNCQYLFVFMIVFY
uniref:PA domain-containing protein n=1 Tax=Sphaeramia orbicularis TaxID=375764 RepID=A0A672Z1J4_9TELE